MVKLVKLDNLTIGGNRMSVECAAYVSICIVVSWLFFGLGFIHQAYIAGPKKSFREGIHDWIADSENDI